MKINKMIEKNCKNVKSSNSTGQKYKKNMKPRSWWMPMNHKIFKSLKNGVKETFPVLRFVKALAPNFGHFLTHI